MIGATNEINRLYYCSTNYSDIPQTRKISLTSHKIAKSYKLSDNKVIIEFTTKVYCLNECENISCR